MSYIYVDLIHKIVAVGFEFGGYDEIMHMLELKTVNKSWAMIIKIEFRKWLNCLLKFENDSIISELKILIKSNYTMSYSSVPNVNSADDIINGIGNVYKYYIHRPADNGTFINITLSTRETNELRVYNINTCGTDIKIFWICTCFGTFTLYGLITSPVESYDDWKLKQVVDKLIQARL